MATKQMPVHQVMLTDEGGSVKEVPVNEAIKDWLGIGVSPDHLNSLLVRRMRASGVYVLNRKPEVLKEAFGKLIEGIRAGASPSFDELLPGKRPHKFELRIAVPEGKVLEGLLGLGGTAQAVTPEPVSARQPQHQWVIRRDPPSGSGKQGRVVDIEKATPEEIASAWHAAVKIPKEMLMDRPEFLKKIIRVTNGLLGMAVDEVAGKAGQHFMPLIEIGEPGLSVERVGNLSKTISEAVDARIAKLQEKKDIPVAAPAPKPVQPQVPSAQAAKSPEPEPRREVPRSSVPVAAKDQVTDQPTPPLHETSDLMRMAIENQDWKTAAEFLKRAYPLQREADEAAWQIFRGALSDHSMPIQRFYEVVDITLRYLTLAEPRNKEFDSLLHHWESPKEFRKFALLIASGNVSDRAIAEVAQAYQIGRAVMKAREAAVEVETQLNLLRELTASRFALVPKVVEKTELVKRPQVSRWRRLLGKWIPYFMVVEQ